ncbi:MAG: hypothetical protein KTR20_15130 [Cellvibrionaceae bacterium]|nr:hypothetical protein [Cellvibrionaceae bacterium]
MIDIVTLTDLIITNGILSWFGLRIVKRVDQLDQRIDDHETRISLNEREIDNAKKSR